MAFYLIEGTRLGKEALGLECLHWPCMWLINYCDNIVRLISAAPIGIALSLLIPVKRARMAFCLKLELITRSTISEPRHSRCMTVAVLGSGIQTAAPIGVPPVVSPSSSKNHC
ncbi:hypothetical protein PMIT1323_00574 [Prochlorococcus marinus str. MIT 1323]|nr:hypothetical protein PMIT1323_00574 [Prochlorococcus marinus str. MIT 1323]